MKTQALWHVALALCLLSIGAAVLWTASSISRERADLRVTQERARKDLAAFQRRTAAAEEAAAATLEGARKDLAEAESALAGSMDRLSAALATDGAGIEQRAGVVATALANGIEHTDTSLNGPGGMLPAARSTVANYATVPASLDKALDASAAAIKDAQDSWDALWPDIQAMADSATVTATSTGQVSQEVRRVAPAVATDAQKTAANVRRMTSWPMVLGRAIISGISRLKFW